MLKYVPVEQAEKWRRWAMAWGIWGEAPRHESSENRDPKIDWWVTIAGMKLESRLMYLKNSNQMKSAVKNFEFGLISDKITNLIDSTGHETGNVYPFAEDVGERGGEARGWLDRGESRLKTLISGNFNII